jgi:hypothetical protein
MQNLLLVIVAPFALAACAANLDPDASEGEAQEIGGPEEIGEPGEIGEVGQALGPEAPYPAPGGPPPGGPDRGGPGHGWGGGMCNDPQYAPYCKAPRPNQSHHPQPDGEPTTRPGARSHEEQMEDARVRARAGNEARARIERIGATVLKTQELKIGKGAAAEAKACRYACNIVRTEACNDVKLACSMGIAAVEIIPGAPVACATLLFTTCVGGFGACYAGCYAAARMKD